MNWIQTIMADVQEREPFWGIIVVPCETSDVPEHLRGKQFVIQMGHALERPPRFTILDEAVEVVASFSCGSHTCLLPWEAIEALITPGTLIIFRPGPRSALFDQASDDEPEPEPKAKPSHLRIVE